MERDLAYAKRMQELSERYPKDHEAAAFYALALLGTARGDRDPRPISTRRLLGPVAILVELGPIPWPAAGHGDRVEG